MPSREPVSYTHLVRKHLGRLLRIDSKMKLERILARLPGGKDQLVGLDRAPGKDGGRGQGSQREVALQLAEALAEGPVEHDAHGTLGPVGRHKNGRPAEVRISKHRMGQEERSRERLGG